jgi:hypothetical protein
MVITFAPVIPAKAGIQLPPAKLPPYFIWGSIEKTKTLDSASSAE